jgi:hypothetical protein
MASIPIVIGMIDYDRSGRAPHDHPGKGAILRRIDLHVRQPRWNMEKIAWVCSGAKLSVLAPSDEAISLDHVGDGLLLAVVMDTGFRPRLDGEEAAPDRGHNSAIGGNGGAPFGSWRLGCSSVEERGCNDSNRLISAHGDILVFRHATPYGKIGPTETPSALLPVTRGPRETNPDRQRSAGRGNQKLPLRQNQTLLVQRWIALP